MSSCVIPTFDVLSNEEIERINGNSFVIQYNKNEVIYKQGHPVTQLLFLKSGLVKLNKDIGADKSIIVGILRYGQFLNLLSFSCGELYQYSAETLENSEIVLTKLSILMDIFNRNGRYSVNMMKKVCQNATLIIDKTLMSSYKHISGRMAQLLLFFAKDVYNNNSFTFPLSRVEIGEFIMATKETVSRTLTEFKNDRMIEIEDKHIILKSFDLIDRLSRLG